MRDVVRSRELPGAAVRRLHALTGLASDRLKQSVGRFIDQQGLDFDDVDLLALQRADRRAGEFHGSCNFEPTGVACAFRNSRVCRRRTNDRPLPQHPACDVLDGVLLAQTHGAWSPRSVRVLRRRRQLRAVGVESNDFGDPAARNDFRHDAVGVLPHLRVLARPYPDRERGAVRRNDPARMPWPGLSVQTKVHLHGGNKALPVQTHAPLWRARLDRPCAMATPEAATHRNPDHR